MSICFNHAIFSHKANAIIFFQNTLLAGYCDQIEEAALSQKRNRLIF